MEEKSEDFKALKREKEKEKAIEYELFYNDLKSLRLTKGDATRIFDFVDHIDSHIIEKIDKHDHEIISILLISLGEAKKKYDIHKNVEIKAIMNLFQRKLYRYLDKIASEDTLYKVAPLCLDDDMIRYIEIIRNSRITKDYELIVKEVSSKHFLLKSEYVFNLIDNIIRSAKHNIPESDMREYCELTKSAYIPPNKAKELLNILTNGIKSDIKKPSKRPRQLPPPDEIRRKYDEIIEKIERYKAIGSNAALKEDPNLTGKIFNDMTTKPESFAIKKIAQEYGVTPDAAKKELKKTPK